jgi:hypothetical protein
MRVFCCIYDRAFLSLFSDPRGQHQRTGRGTLLVRAGAPDATRSGILGENSDPT